MMTAAHWQRLKPIVLYALDLDEPERVAFLRRACAGDDLLLADALSLLNAPDEVLPFSDTPLVNLFV